MRRKPYCPFCRLVLTALGGPDVPSFEDGEPVSVAMSWDTEERKAVGPPGKDIPDIRYLRLGAEKGKGRFVDSDRVNLFTQLMLLANDAPTSSKILFARPIKEDQIDFAMVRNWISMCENWHGSSCNKSQMFRREVKSVVDEIPSFRLIDVVDNCIIRAPKNSKYAALSYVWGKVDFLRTLKVSWRIPGTILDAMEVTRELNIRYLWVDSLCIIQDDDTGAKADAISKMDIVYGACFITIMAATGIDANAGLPGVRPGSRGQRQPIEEIMPGLRLSARTRYQYLVKDSPYYTRAWTNQEMEYTPRSLIFIGGQVVFRCRKADQWREDVVFEDETVISKGRGEYSGDTSMTGDEIGTFEGLILSYSQLSLSFDSDIYNAFAGISNFIKTEFKINLCHGIPDAYFDWFLLWKSFVPQVRRQGAPSWSWSGWIGGSSSDIWDWCDNDPQEIRKEIKKRTWIIWYERVAHDSVEFMRVLPMTKLSSSTNFYGGRVKKRFPFDCSQTLPTPRTLVGAPKYYEDILNSTPLSGFLQFWTVAVTFNLGTPTSKANLIGPEVKFSRVGIVGRDGRELGTALVNPDWHNGHVPGKYEFILLCEGKGSIDDAYSEERYTKEWKYRVMLIEWHGEWAERVTVGWIEKHGWEQSFEPGPNLNPIRTTSYFQPQRLFMSVLRPCSDDGLPYRYSLYQV
ncbi:heterokaryon incompatibility protein-domain-containing protein [Flammula alnicola]|nr:heterokaryon incompatibility protein-domain-containing protein [Flammula alnicola]